jgi:hypothetical protein
VGDLDINDKKLYWAKKISSKNKIIPEILLKIYPIYLPLIKAFFIHSTQIGGEWIATENNRRDNFSTF